VLAILDDCAAVAGDGEGQLVLIRGEAGAGKTTLVTTLRERLPAARWLWGSCDGWFTPRPLGPLFDIAAQAGGELAAVCRDESRRERMFQVLLEECVAAPTLIVLVIEDIHWADEATLDLVRFLGKRLQDCRTMLLVTYRDDALPRDHPLHAVLGDLSARASTNRINLPPLSSSAVATLARDAGMDPSALYQLTGGNPFFVTEVLGAGSGVVPLSAAEVVMARVARLSPAARRVLEAAAIIGPRVELGLLRRVDPADSDSIDACLDTGILLSGSDGFRFRHEIARMALESAIPVHRRADLHGRILGALRDLSPGDDARLAHHAEGAVDRAAVLEHAPKAAERAAALSAHREAAAQFERALRFSDGLDIAVKAQLYFRLGDESALIDDWEAATEARAAALALWREVGDPLRIGDTLRRLSRSKWRLCLGEEAQELAEAAVAELEQLQRPTAELARAYANLATVLMSRDDEAAIRFAQQAQALAASMGDDQTLSEALNTEGSSRFYLRQPDGLELVREALDVALATNHPEQAGRAYTNIHTILVNSYRFGEAEECYTAGVAHCEDHDIGTYGICLRGGATAALTFQGRWTEAETLCIEMLERRQMSPINRLSPLTSLGVIRARQGRLEEAAKLLDDALELAVGTQDEAGFIAEPRLARMEAAWLRGDIDSAITEANALLTHLPSEASMLGSTAVWARRLGLPVPDISGVVGIAEAVHRQVAGDWRAAAQLWHDLACPYEAALAQLDSDDEDALRGALATFDQLGAMAAVAVTRAKMRRLGFRAIPRGRRSTTKADRFGLTTREREVLEHVCAGMTNSDIAVRLVISERTVDHHVSAVLAKMGVDSRRHAASKAAELGLLDVVATT
jgi:DNA-binding CsgD family transcriptional regulator/tetratricopeptide (TPR) repeat protein